MSQEKKTVPDSENRITEKKIADKKTSQKRNRVTIRQVAERAGVTIGTVSHVINGTATISQETSERVREAITELHYVPNLTARSLRSKKSKVVGLLIPNLNNSFFSRISSTFIDLAFENGYIVQILGYEYSLEKELQAIGNLASDSVDIVVILNGFGDEKGIKQLLDARKKVILADRTSDIPGVNCVCFDNRSGVTAAVKLLKTNGYQRIGFLSEPLALTNVQERFAAYQAALEEFGYTFSQEDVFICESFRLNAMTNGYNYVKEILQSYKKSELPDAFIATSDLLAIGAIRAFRECGYSVPGDVGMVSFDNLDIASFVDPGLTTIEQNQTLMGKELFRMVKAISENEAVSDKVVLPQNLIIRGSC